MVLITAVYVIATIVICVYNAKSATAAKEQTAEMKVQFAEIHRPKINIKFEVSSAGLLCFVIENVGLEPADNLSLGLSKDFYDNAIKYYNTENSNLWFDVFERKDLYLATRQQITVIVGGKGYFNQIASVPAEFNVRYNNIYNEKIIIDIKQYAYTLSINSPTENIYNILCKLQEEQGRFQKKIISQNEALLKAPINVVTREASDKEIQKFELYKIIALKHTLSLKEISEKADLSLEYTHELLLELYLVDDLVSVYHGENANEINEEMKWYRKN